MKKIKIWIALCLSLLLFVKIAPTAEAASEIQLHTAYYGVNRKDALVGKVMPQTRPEELLRQFVANGQLHLTNGVKTGSRVELLRGDQVLDSLTLVVQGDCNGDGGFSVTDMLTVKSTLLEQQTLSGAKAQAADLSGDGKVTITDFLQMKSIILKQKKLSSQQLSGTTLPACRVLQLGSTMPFGSAGATGADVPVVEGNAVTWEKGVLTAKNLGTSRVCSGEEKLLLVVTELPQSVAFTQKSLVLNPGASQKLGLEYRYPVYTAAKFGSSNPKVVTVDASGTVKAVGVGTATVTVTLDNGASASMTVQVIPLLEKITLNTNSMKLKPGTTKTLTAKGYPENTQEPLEWTSSDPSIATVDGQGRVKGVSYGTVTITCTGKYSRVSASCKVKVCNLVQVALTFDDGPGGSKTTELLDALKKYNVKATFFLVGNRIGFSESIVKRTAAEGHEFGYHSWAHGYFNDMTAAEIKQDYEMFQKALYEACHAQATVYRSPGGISTEESLRTIPLPHILWSVDTLDWQHRDPAKVKKNILEGLKDGRIILMHDIHQTTIEGTIAALEYIYEHDLDVEFVTVTQLLSRNGKTPSAGQTYYSG